jgi:hypothetical protein
MENLTTLKAQIEFMETVNKIFPTPLSISIKNSLIELQAIKQKSNKEQPPKKQYPIHPEIY